MAKKTTAELTLPEGRDVPKDNWLSKEKARFGKNTDSFAESIKKRMDEVAIEEAAVSGQTKNINETWRELGNSEEEKASRVSIAPKNIETNGSEHGDMSKSKEDLRKVLEEKEFELTRKRISLNPTVEVGAKPLTEEEQRELENQKRTIEVARDAFRDIVNKQKETTEVLDKE